MQSQVQLTYIGGPTAIIELNNRRFIIDPTFDPPGDHPVADRVLRKLKGPAISIEEIGRFDMALLSHAHHPDNLDNLGRNLLIDIPLVVSTPDSRIHLGMSHVRTLKDWESIDLPYDNLQITSVPALHGPSGSEKKVGKVMGFIISGENSPTIYISGDNASIDIVKKIKDFIKNIDIAIVFAGAARTTLANGANLTLTSLQTEEATRILNPTHIVPLHFEHWAHFTENAFDLREAFKKSTMNNKLIIPIAGETYKL